MTLDRWVPFRNESTSVRCRVFSFPHAGGCAAFYRQLRRCMPPEIDFCPLELPGRAARLDEPPLTSMDALMEELSVLRPLMAVPFGFFGHSVGAHAAYEAAAVLRSADGRSAVQLFVSGRGRPASLAPPPRTLSDRELLAILDRFGGTPAEVRQRPELIAAFLPALRADLALVDAYTIGTAESLSCPITAFGGADDIQHSSALERWSGLTRDRFRVRVLPGGHFYFSHAPGALADEIVQDLSDAAGARAADTRSPA